MLLIGNCLNTYLSFVPFIPTTPFFLHYEKLHLSKPHYSTTKTQKIIHIQLLCNYPLDITTSV